MEYQLKKYRSKYKRTLNAIKVDIERGFYELKNRNPEELKGKKIRVEVDFVITTVLESDNKPI